MSNDYIIKFTDPLKTANSFAVKPYTFDGHLSPSNPALYTNVDTGVYAVSANTSLVFLGKGMPDYGEAVQNNLVYLLEHFANSAPPLEPVEGQLWYKNVDLVDAPNPTNRGLYIHNGTSWERVIIETVSGATGDIDMGGVYRVINLATPINSGDASTKQYVDDVHGINTDYTLHLTSAQNTFLDSLVVTAAEVNYLSGTSSSVQTQLNGKLSLTGGTMSGVIDMGFNRISQLAAPLVADDAATKAYVDSVAGTGGIADGVVNSGSLDGITGVLTLGRTIGGPVIVTGEFAAKLHTQADTTVTHDLAAPLSQSFLVGRGMDTGQFPTMPVYDAIANIDQALYSLQRHVHRELITSTGTTTVNFSSTMSYEVNVNKLQVFVNGIKQYANERGSSKIVYTGTTIGLTSEVLTSIADPTGLAPSTAYSFDITVDGGAPTTITITTPAGPSYTFADLLTAIDAALTTALVPASVNIDQYLGYLKITFVSHTAGAGSAVTVSYAVGSLFEVLASKYTGASPVNTSITTSYSYTEVGLPNAASTSITFMTAPVTGAVIEVLIWP